MLYMVKELKVEFILTQTQLYASSTNLGDLAKLSELVWIHGEMGNKIMAWST